MQDSFFAAEVTIPTNFSPIPDLNFDHPPFFDMSTPPYMRELPRPQFGADAVTKSLSSLFDDTQSVPPNSATRPAFSGQSPSLMDLLLPGSELNARPGSVSIPPLSLSTPSLSMSPIDTQFMPQMGMPTDLAEDDVEEIIREEIPDSESWMSRSPVPFPTRSTTPQFFYGRKFRLEVRRC
jgi:hypothetical protein